MCVGLGSDQSLDKLLSTSCSENIMKKISDHKSLKRLLAEYVSKKSTGELKINVSLCCSYALVGFGHRNHSVVVGKASWFGLK